MKKTILLLPILLLLLAACMGSTHTQTITPTVEMAIISTPSQIPSLPITTSTVVPIQKTNSPRITYPSVTPSEITKKFPTITAEKPEKPVPTSVIDTITTIPSPPGRLYVFDDVVYGYLNPNTIQYSINPLSPKSPGVIGPTGAAISLAFSYYSQQVAYITDDEELTLWVGDLALHEVNSVWVDNKKWLNYEAENNDEIKIWWGPQDKYLILVNRSHFVVFSLQDNSAIELLRKCNWLSVSPKTGQFAVWCPAKIGNNGYIVLEQDGHFWSTSSLPDVKYNIDDWVFSPDGRRVLYASSQGDLIIVDKSGDQLVLPVRYQSPRWDITMRVMQWSRDGHRTLVYGYDQRIGLCPKDPAIEHPCWFVLDSKTGEIVWWPTGKVSTSDCDATLSPDGEWIVLFVLHVPFRYGYVISITSNDTIQIYDWLVDPVSWGD